MIEYIPKEFHEVELGFYQNEENICTPHFPDACSKVLNEIFINAPQQIICNPSDSLIIPLCGVFMVSEKRGLKYGNQPNIIFHLSKYGEEEFPCEIVDLNAAHTNPYIPPNYYEKEAKRQQAIAEAQNYSEEELNEIDGLFLGKVFNVDIAQYVKIPLIEGEYTVYVSKCGLESNRVHFNIVYRKEMMNDEK